MHQEEDNKFLEDRLPSTSVELRLSAGELLEETPPEDLRKSMMEDTP